MLPHYPPKLRERALASLVKLGVTVEMNSRVVDITPDSVTLKQADALNKVATRTVLWAAGVQANALGRTLSAATGAEVDRAGRLIVADDCTLPGHPEIFVIGDLASYQHGSERPLPGVAPVAIQQGHYVAGVISRRLNGKSTRPFKYFNMGSMATIGRAQAVAHFGRLQLSGLIAWLAWLFVHLFNLIGYTNRYLVLVQWGINYFTRNRSARLITEEHALRLARKNSSGEAVAGEGKNE